MKKTARRTELRVALLYALFGGLWILLSDRLLATFITDVTLLTTLQTYKGWLYVITSALLIYVLLRREENLRKIAEEKYEESEERYRLLFETSIDAFLLTAPDGSIHAANPTATRLFGWTEEEIKKVGRDGVVDNSDPRLAVALEKRAQKGHFRGELTFVRKDGTKFPGEISTTIFTDEQGNKRSSMVIRDITKRKKADDALRESQERLRLFIEHAPASLAMFDREMRYLAVSHRWISDYGLRGQDIIGRSHYEVFPEISDEWKQIHQRGMAGEVILADEDKFLRADGSVQWLRWEVRPWFTADENIGGIVIFTEDITAQVQTEENLRESEARFRTLVEQTPAITYTAALDEDSTTLYISPQIEQYLGYTPKEYLKDPEVWSQSLHPDDRQRVLNEIYQSHASGESLVTEYRMLSRDNRVVWFRDTANVVRDKAGKPMFLQGLMFDITQRKTAERQIQQQLQRMRALNEIDRAISSSMDMRVSLEILLNNVLTQLEVDAASVLLLNETNHKLEYFAGQGYRTAAIRNSQMNIGEGYPGKAGLEHKIIHIPNLKVENGEFKRAELLKEENFVEYWGVPLVAKGKLKGVLEIFHRSYLDTDPDWDDYLNTLSGQAAIAVDNAQLFEGMQKSNLELIAAYDATIAGWSRAMDLRDQETEGHTQRVTELTMQMAEKMGADPKELIHIRRGALLHDIGKLGVPDRILLKAGELTPEEWVIMRQHPVHAFEMLRTIPYLQAAIDIPYFHHEKWDGSGYPRGLQGEQIPLAARLFAIVDVWDALTSDRPYRPAWTKEKALAYIKEQTGRHFDPSIVDVFLNALS